MRGLPRHHVTCRLTPISQNGLGTADAFYDLAPGGQTRLAADVNGDWSVDQGDLLCLGTVWGATAGSEIYLMEADIVTDGIIDARDLLYLIGTIGEE